MDQTPIRQVVLPSTSSVRLRMVCDFHGDVDLCTLYVYEHDTWIPLIKPHPMYFKMNVFTGGRVGLFCFATQSPGGFADFHDFHFEAIQPSDLPSILGEETHE